MPPKISDGQISHQIPSAKSQALVKTSSWNTNLMSFQSQSQTIQIQSNPNLLLSNQTTLSSNPILKANQCRMLSSWSGHGAECRIA